MVRPRLGGGKTEAAQGIPDLACHAYAELLGLKGVVVRDRKKLGDAWDEASAADRPVAMNVCADPNMPPPHTSFKDAKNLLAMRASEPELGNVSKNSVKQALAGVPPGKG